MIKIPASRPAWARRCWHEAGHAVAAAAIGALEYVSLRDDLQGSHYRLGHVCHRASALDEQLLITAAGPAAERLVLGNIELDEGDEQRFTALCRDAGLDVAAMQDVFRRWAAEEVTEHRAWIEAVAVALARSGYLDRAAVLALRPKEKIECTA